MPSTSQLAMFPLGLVTYPTVGLNLHIYEERYRQLIADAQTQNITFGIAPVLENGEMQSVGTEMRLASIEKTYEDGRLDIKTLGIRRFKVLDMQIVTPGKLYGSATVEFLETDYEGDHELYQVILEQIQLIFDIFQIDKNIPANDSNLNTFKLISQAALNIDQELELIKIDTEVNRQLYIIDHLNIFIPKAQEMEAMRKKVQMNGHFRNLIPPNLS